MKGKYVRLLLILGLLLQEKPPEPEKIVARIPEFFFLFGVMDWEDGRGVPVKLIPPKEGQKIYILQKLNNDGDEIDTPKIISEAGFYEWAGAILRHGVKDHYGDDTLKKIDSLYRDFVKLLLEKGIVEREGLRGVGRAYAKFKWLESLYWLDEAMPGVFLENVKDFTVVDNQSHNKEYFTMLVGIKLGKENRKKLDEAAERINAIMEKKAGPNKTYGYSFPRYAYMLGELCRKGAILSEQMQTNLAQAYLIYSEISFFAMRATFAYYGLPMPTGPVLQVALTDRIRILGDLARLDKKMKFSLLRLVADFRCWRLNFPEEFAASFRDALFQHFGEVGSFEDIEYLSRITGDAGVAPEILKRYGDWAMDWHFNTQNENRRMDTSDYYHAAVECYRRLDPGKLNPDRLKKLRDSYQDLTIRMRDLIIAHELAGLGPKDEFFLEKLEKRMERSGSLREEIELAAYLDQHPRTSRAIDKVVEETLKMIREEKDRGDSSETPAYENLGMMVNLLKYLKFQDGLYTLAQRLHDAGMEAFSRQLFIYLGVDKVSERWKDFYGQHGDEYWQQREKEFNLRMRNPRDQAGFCINKINFSAAF